MIGPQLQLWDEQQVCAGCALQKSVRAKRDRADRTRVFYKSAISAGIAAKAAGEQAPPNRLFNIRVEVQLR